MKTTSILFLILFCTTISARARDKDWESDYTVQGLLGAAEFRDLHFNINDSATPAEADFSLLPQAGGAWHTSPHGGERFQYGLEASFLIGTQVEKLNYLYLGGGGVRISLSTSLWLFDLAGGAYANLYLDNKQRVRLYAAAGPVLMFANYRTEKDFSDGSDSETASESALGAGAYARAGIEFRIHENGMAGIGVRNTWSNMDFSDAGGSEHLRGTAIFATYTLGF